jgi:hypothetical protein
MPILAEPPVFPHGADFKQWLLVKCKATSLLLRYLLPQSLIYCSLLLVINAERCAYDAPSFAKPIRTMRSQMLVNLFEPFAAGIFLVCCPDD